MQEEASPEWRHDESRHVGVDYADPAVVGDYDRRHAKFRDFEKDTQLIIDRLGLTSKDVVIDLGCGTGAFAIPAARVLKKVVAVDISAAMLHHLDAKAKQAGLTNVETRLGGFLTYRHEGQPADAVVTVAALHHLPDFWKAVALRRMHAMLKPGGRLYLFDVVFSFPIEDCERGLSEWVNLISKSAPPEVARETAIHARDEFSTFDWVMEGMFERAGFSVLGKHADFPQCLAYVCAR